MNNKYIDVAYKEAIKAFKINEVPVGAVIVKNNIVISKAYNVNHKTNTVINHAEILAISKASKKIGDWRLNDCDMYVTLEPCPMCAGAILQSRIKNLYIGTSSNIESNKKIISEIFHNSEYYHDVNVIYLNYDRCAKILSDFFQNKR